MSDLSVVRQTSAMVFQPTSIAEALSLAETLSKSILVPQNFRGKPDDVFAAMMLSAELGISPMQGIQNIAVINGRATVWGDMAIALVKSSPLCEGVEESMDLSNPQNPIATCVARRKNMPDVVSTFSWGEAVAAGLTTKGVWLTYPKRMLQMRARGFALRDQFADLMKGLITSEEAQDYPVRDSVTNDVLTPVGEPTPLPEATTSSEVVGGFIQPEAKKRASRTKKKEEPTEAELVTEFVEESIDVTKSFEQAEDTGFGTLTPVQQATPSPFGNLSQPTTSTLSPDFQKIVDKFGSIDNAQTWLVANGILEAGQKLAEMEEVHIKLFVNEYLPNINL